LPGLLDGKSIVVVDDDPDIVTAIRTALSDTGAAIECANDGQTAVDLVESKSPDLVVLDIMLPKKSGFLVLERIKKGKKKGEKPYVVMITGNQGTRHRQYAEALGVDAYISKPFGMDEIVEKANALLRD
jgi:DNA-binding response OmpR family regulator